MTNITKEKPPWLFPAFICLAAIKCLCCLFLREFSTALWAAFAGWWAYVARMWWINAHSAFSVAQQAIEHLRQQAPEDPACKQPPGSV